MNAELLAIKEAHIEAGRVVNESDVAEKAEHDAVREMANQYVAAHPEEFTSAALGGIDLTDVEAMVNAVDVFRAAGLEDFEWKFEVWLLHAVPPQNIGGEYKATVNITNPTEE